MTTQAERHERLAENVAIAGDCSLTEARAILALIASRLADVTPEMKGDAMMAWLNYELVDAAYSDGQSIAIWRAMLLASPLVKGALATKDEAK